VSEEQSDVLCLFPGGSSEALRGDISPFKVLKSFPPVGSGLLEKMIRNSPKLL
jgi:hypothetical protein